MKSYALSLTSAFSTTSLLKARVKMLYRKPSAKLALVKFGFVLPIVLICFAVSACIVKKNNREEIMLDAHKKITKKIYLEKDKGYAFWILPNGKYRFQDRNLVKYTLWNEGKRFLKYATITDDQYPTKEPTEIFKAPRTGTYFLEIENYGIEKQIVFRKTVYSPDSLQVGKVYMISNGKLVDTETLLRQSLLLKTKPE